MASKYKNVKTEIDGITFDSIKEAKRYQELKLLVRAGIIKVLVLQKPFPIVVNGVKICTYKCDFSYYGQDGRETVEDVKGVRTAVFSIKAKLMIAVYGLRVLET